MTKQVIYKADKLWLKAEVVKKVQGGYILTCGSTREFFVKEDRVREVAA